MCSYVSLVKQTTHPPTYSNQTHNRGERFNRLNERTDRLQQGAVDFFLHSPTHPPTHPPDDSLTDLPTHLLNEYRGERLNRLNEQTERLQQGAVDFAEAARALAEREKNKAWYEF